IFCSVPKVSRSSAQAWTTPLSDSMRSKSAPTSDRRAGSAESPRHQGPQAFVQVVDHDLGHDLDGRDAAGEAYFAGDKETDDERVDGADRSPTHGLHK